MSCPVVTHPDPGTLSPRPKSKSARSRRSSPAASRESTHETWHVHFEQHKRDLEYHVQQNKPVAPLNFEILKEKASLFDLGEDTSTGNSSQRSVKALQSLDSTSQGESLAEAVATAARREFSIMQDWMTTQIADQKIWCETAFSEMKDLQLRVLDGVKELCMACNTKQEKHSSPILKGTAREDFAPIQAQCIGNARAVSWSPVVTDSSEYASKENEGLDMAPFIDLTSSTADGLQKHKTKARVDELQNKIGNASFMIPPREFSSVSAPVNMQLLEQDMLLDFEAGIKQGLEQLRVKIAEEINVLLAQSSSSSVTVDPKSSPIRDRRSQQPVNAAETSTPLHMQRSSTLSNEYRQNLNLTIDEKKEETLRIPHGIRHTIATINFVKAQSKESQQRPLYRFAVSNYFAEACIVVVVLNAIWLGYEVDQDSANEHGWIKSVSITFNIWFMLELGIRIAGLRTDFIVGPDWLWNVVDTLCVVISIPDFFSSSLNVSVLRMIRLCKLSKALRLVRVVKIFRSLRVILTTVFFTLGSLFWSFVAMLFVAYIFAILLIQAVRLHADEGVQFGSKTTDNFSSVYTSILALFSMITGGQEWFGIAQDMGTNGGYLAEYLLIFWIFFVLFGLVNVVVAVFCAEAVQAEDSQRDLRLQKESDTRTEKISELMEVFQMIDTETRGWITWEQFHKFATDTEGSIILESHGLLLIALEPLWHRMVGHRDTDQKVDISGFVMGFLRVSHEHMNTDLLLLAQAIKGLRNELREVLQNGCNDITGRRSSKKTSLAI